MRWSRAIYHLETLAQECARWGSLASDDFPLFVTQLWAAREVLGDQRDDLEVLTVVPVVDLPAAKVPWLSRPHGADWWENATRVSKTPIVPLWRSSRAPVWNHYIERPALVWHAATGVAEATIEALRTGSGETVRMPAPSPEEVGRRLDQELAVSLAALRAHTKTYDQQRWRPGRIDRYADALWRASDGYLDILDAIHHG